MSVGWMEVGWVLGASWVMSCGGWRTQPCQFFHGLLARTSARQSFSESQVKHGAVKTFHWKGILFCTLGNILSEKFAYLCIVEVGSCTFFLAWLTTLLVSFNAQDPGEEETGWVCHGPQSQQIDNLGTKTTRRLQRTIWPTRYWKLLSSKKCSWGSFPCGGPGGLIELHKVSLARPSRQKLLRPNKAIIALLVLIAAILQRMKASFGSFPPDLFKWSIASFERLDHSSLVLLGVEPLHICEFVTDSCPVRLRVPKFPSTQKSR